MLFRRLKNSAIDGSCSKYPSSPMQMIHFHGSYRYEDQATLESALRQARAHFPPDDHLWFRCFVSNGSFLTVNLAVPSEAHRILDATTVFLHLSRGAVEGAFAADRRAVT